ncbi:hypothetical protein F8O01_14100 [Pseudoclavibacter chungangensis]|uniref:Uncharacterized protein n=1 Tax=Pseudoclavibacter chungangensis TaxID=587635 RepID=A0A7J5BNS3_9MICO|nr:OsmC family protein [Pseudoclavibacter chungangensis]KAB1654045.1 hypothetical protein F8O01_14100 [Pseudoclavibacter chungangensis]NYJ66047.1 organic hydroperoxide reductase OsmC/OhrA [Pseudoclavibacter chungangensis]
MTDSTEALYTATAVNRTGATGESAVVDGLRVAVRSPLAPPDPGGTASVRVAARDDRASEDATNPEELLALAWATCLGASARVVAGDDREVGVRVVVELHRASPGPGYEFRPRAFIAFADTSDDEAAALAVAAHERCPVSKLLSGRSEAIVVAEPYGVHERD